MLDNLSGTYNLKPDPPDKAQPKEEGVAEAAVGFNVKIFSQREAVTTSDPSQNKGGALLVHYDEVDANIHLSKEA